MFSTKKEKEDKKSKKEEKKEKISSSQKFAISLKQIESSDVIQEKLTTLSSALMEARFQNEKLEIKKLQTQLRVLGQEVEKLFKEATLVSTDFKTIAKLFNQSQAIAKILTEPTYKTKILNSLKSGDFKATVQRLYPERFQEKGLPKRLVEYSTHQLVLAYNQEDTPLVRKQQLEKIMLEVLEQFAQTKIWTPPLMAAVLPLAACNNPRIAQQLLERFLGRLQKSVLLDPIVAESIGTLIRFANHKTEKGFRRALDPDALVQVLNLFNERLSKLHRSPASRQKLSSLLQGLTSILNAMLEQEVTGLSEEKTKDLSQQLRDLRDDEEVDADNRFYAAYGQEALARLPDERSSLRQYLGCGLSIGKGVIGLACTLSSSIANPDPSALLDNILELKDSIMETVDVVRRHQKGSWYELYRTAETLIESGPKALAQLYNLLQEPNFKPDEKLSLGLVLQFLPLLQSKNPAIRRQVWPWIIRLTGVSLSAEKKKEISFILHPPKKTGTQWPVSEMVQRKVLAYLKSLSSDEPDTSINLLRLLEKQYREQLIEKLTAVLTPEASTSLLTRFSFSKTKAGSKSELKEKKESSEESLEKAPIESLENEVDVTRLLVVKAYQTILPLDYRLEQIWEQMEQFLFSKEVAEDLQYYVPLTGVNRLEELNQEKPKLFDLREQVSAFLGNTSNTTRLILIQGPSGSGKSLFGRHLQQELWEKYNPGQPIPLFIMLGQLKDPSQRCVEQTLENLGCTAEEIQGLKKERQFILYLDGYDEIKTFKNLYKTNELSQWNAKVIITSRLGYLTGNYQNLFQTGEKGESIQEYFIAPFRKEQIKLYLNNLMIVKYKSILDKETKARTIQNEVERLINELEVLPGINQLIESPFVLKIVVEVLPVLQQQQKKGEIKNITRGDIYKVFIEKWYDREESKIRNVQDLKLRKFFKLRESFQIFGEDFAFTLLLNKKVVAPMAADRYQTPEDIAEDKWMRFFNEKETEVTASRRGVPLKYIGNTVQFIHKSLLEYYVACRLIKEITLDREERPLGSKFYFNQINLVQEKAIFNFLQDFIQGDKDKIEALFEMVIYSKDHPEASRMATNALSLLVFMGVPCSERNLGDIHAPGSDLRKGIFDTTNFERANLQGCDLEGAWIRKANFTNANLLTARFGERPSLLFENNIETIAYSPDGRWIASVCHKDKDITLWDAVSSERYRILKGHTDSVFSIAISPDNKTLVSGDLNGTIKIWNIESGKELHTLKETAVSSVAISPNSKTVISVSVKNKTIKIWDVINGKELRTLNWHTDEALKENLKSEKEQVVISPDSKIVMLVSSDDTIKIWDVESGEEVRTLNISTKNMNIVAVSPNNKTIVSGEGKIIKILDMESGKELRTLEVYKDKGMVRSIAISSDGKTLVLGSDSEGKTIKILDMESGEEVRILRGHTADVTNVAVSLDKKTVVSGSLDKMIKIWNMEGGKEQFALKGHTDNVSRVAVNSDGKTMVSASSDNTIKIWGVEIGKELHTLKGHTNNVTSVAISSDGKTVVSGSWDTTLKVWDVASGQELRTLKGHLGKVYGVAISLDNKTIASLSQDGMIKLWELESGKEQLKISLSSSWGMGVAISPDKRTVVSGGLDNVVSVWDVTTGKKRFALKGHDGYIAALDISSDNKVVVSGSGDSTIKLWDLASGQLLRTLTGHTGDVLDVSISPDNRTLASGSCDRTIKIWDMCTGKLLEILKGHLGDVNSVAWKQDTLVTGSEDNAVNCWRIHRDTTTDVVSEALLWSSHPNSLQAQDCQLERAILSDRDTRLLKQKGAIGYPTILAQDHLDWNTLHFAVAKNNLEQIVEAAKTCSLDSHTKDAKETALHIAVRYQSRMALQYLLDQGANAFLKNAQDQLPSELAENLGLKDLLAYLPKEDKENPTQTPLHLAAGDGYESVVAYLLKWPIEVNQKNAIGETALHVAASQNQVEILKLLRMQGADLLAKDNQGNTALHKAAINNRLQALNWLLAEGLPVDSLNEAQLTPLALAVRNPNKEVFELLLGKGANPLGIKLENGNSLLHWAAQNGPLKIVEMLLNTGIDVEIKNDNFETAVHCAACNNKDGLEILKLLKVKGAGLSIKNNKLGEPLHYAARLNNIAIIKWLLEEGCFIDALGVNSYTPLHYAASNGQQEAVKLLLEKGASSEALTQEGKTPTQLARENNKEKVAKLIERYGRQIGEIKNLELQATKGPSLTGHTDSVSSVAISPDKKTVVSGSSDTTIKIWDMESGQELHTLKGHKMRVSSVAISSDGKTVVSGSWDTTLKVWDVKSGKELHTLKGHTSKVYRVVISFDNKTIVSIGEDAMIKLWELENGKEQLTIKLDSSWNMSLAISPDKKTIVSGGLDNVVSVWDAISGKKRCALKGHGSYIADLVISSDNKTVVSGSGDSTLKVWDMESEKEVYTLEGHTSDVSCVAISPDGKILVSGDDGNIRFWDMSAGELVKTYGYLAGINSIAWQQDILVTGSNDNVVNCWGIQIKATTSFRETSDIKLATLTSELGTLTAKPQPEANNSSLTFSKESKGQINKDKKNSRITNSGKFTKRN